jgi:hypothetical protein
VDRWIGWRPNLWALNHPTYGVSYWASFGQGKRKERNEKMKKIKQVAKFVIFLPRLSPFFIQLQINRQTCSLLRWENRPGNRTVGKQGWKNPVVLSATCCGSKSLQVILIDSDFGDYPVLNPLVTL